MLEPFPDMLEGNVILVEELSADAVETTEVVILKLLLVSVAVPLVPCAEVVTPFDVIVVLAESLTVAVPVVETLTEPVAEPDAVDEDETTVTVALMAELLVCPIDVTVLVKESIMHPKVPTTPLQVEVNPVAELPTAVELPELVVGSGVVDGDDIAVEVALAVEPSVCPLGVPELVWHPSKSSINPQLDVDPATALPVVVALSELEMELGVVDEDEPVVKVALVVELLV